MRFYAGIHHSKYWMPIHYDTIKDGGGDLIFYSLIIQLNSLILVHHCNHMNIVSIILCYLQPIFIQLVHATIMVITNLRAVASLSLPGGQDTNISSILLYLPVVSFKFSSISSSFWSSTCSALYII